MKLSQLLEAKTYRLVNYDGEELYRVDMYGNTYNVEEVYKDSALLSGPDGEENIFDIDEIMEQDDFVAGIK